MSNIVKEEFSMESNKVVQGEEKLDGVGLAEEEVNNENQIINHVDVDIVFSRADLGKAFLEIDKAKLEVKNEIPEKIAEKGINIVLSKLDHGGEVLEVDGLKKEKVKCEIQEEIIVTENNNIVFSKVDHGGDMLEIDGLAEKQIGCKKPAFNLVNQVYNIGLSKFNHEEEILSNVSYNVEIKVKNSVRKYLPNLNITSVMKVENNFLAGMYYLKKEEYQSRNISVTEQKLFHSTSVINVNSIIKDNLDWKRSFRCKYGSGVSFATDADYANCHSNRHNGEDRVFIIAKVLVGNSTQGYCGLTIPPEGYDTTTGANDIVVVKYNHNEFLPKYVVYYHCPDITKIATK